MTDRGTHFANKTIAKLCEFVNVTHKFSTPYHPQTNGLVENLNGTLVNTLRKLTIKNPTKWDQWVPTALYAYRTRVHSTLGITPYEMLYGVRPRNSDPIQLAAQTLGEERLLAMTDQRNQIHDNLVQNQSYQWTPELNYKKGDLVLIKRVKKLKIQPPWYETPYVVYNVHENNTYDLVDKNGEFFPSRVNAARMKLFHDKEGLFAHFYAN